VGSGFIVNPRGDILTNFHVIQEVNEANNRDQIWVSIAGESEPRQADIVGVDNLTDLALLRLRKTDGKQFPALPFGDSDQLRMGNIVMAFGSPFGLSETATQGIISNCKRRLGDSPEKAPVIQTDVVLNPGSSGGPLINLRGEVVGINWAVYTGDPNVHSWQGIGLSIPSNDAKDSLAKLLNTKQLRGYVGLAFSDDVSPFHDTRAVTIAVATPGSPAAMAGLAAGDVVLKIDGAAVTSEVDAWKRVKRKKVGEAIEFEVTRAGRALPPIMITVQDMDQDGPMLPKPLNLTRELGIWVKDADAKDLRILKTRGWTRGPKCVVITEVTPDSPLAKQEKAGDFTILEGDVIRATGPDKEHLKPLATSADFAEILKQWKKGTPMTLNIWRDQHTESINMKLER
jgi:serine protease Do